MRWVAKAPTSWFTSDGNADRLGIFGRFTFAFYRVGCLQRYTPNWWVAIRINAEFTVVLGRVEE